MSEYICVNVFHLAPHQREIGQRLASLLTIPGWPITATA